jgi:hypothetical protein
MSHVSFGAMMGTPLMYKSIIETKEGLDGYKNAILMYVACKFKELVAQKVQMYLKYADTTREGRNGTTKDKVTIHVRDFKNFITEELNDISKVNAVISSINPKISPSLPAPEPKLPNAQSAGSISQNLSLLKLHHLKIECKNSQKLIKLNLPVLIGPILQLFAKKLHHSIQNNNLKNLTIKPKAKLINS